MRKISYKPYLLLIVFFFFVMSLPKTTSEKMRSMAVCSLSPVLKGIFVATKVFKGAPHAESVNEIQRLTQENHLLRTQLQSVKQWLVHEERMQKEIERYKLCLQTSPDEDFFKRRIQELAHLLELQAYSVPAQVIFREPASWSSTLWINAGEKNNTRLGKQIISVNSPVVLGTTVVGIVEYVGSSQSRVRLITDARLTPSVRAVRGGEQNLAVLEHLDALIFSLERRQDLFSSDAERTTLAQTLLRLKASLQTQSKSLYLAKGELRGTSNPLWRSRSQILKGVGFNYDFPDQEGPARDLRTGLPYGQKGGLIPLLLPGDLLVTTGLDGVFPQGLHVATVSSIQTLKEGASSYEIEAVVAAGDLEEIAHVFVLPSLQVIDIK